MQARPSMWRLERVAFIAWMGSLRSAVRLFLICVLAQCAGMSAENPPTRASEYFASFLLARYGAAEVRRISDFPFQTRDDKNGYCSSIMDHGGDRYTFAVWNKE